MGTDIPASTAGAAGYAPPSWFDTAYFRLKAAVGTLNAFTGWRAGVNTAAASTLGTGAEAGIEGGWLSSVGATAFKLSLANVWQALKNNPAGMSFRAKFPAVSTNIQQIGASNASHGMQIALLSSIDATKWFLRINGAGETDVLLSVADTNPHNFDLYYDPTVAGGTISVAIDGVVVGTTTTLTNLTADAQFPQIFSNNGGTSGVAIQYALWGWHE